MLVLIRTLRALFTRFFAGRKGAEQGQVEELPGSALPRGRDGPPSPSPAGVPGLWDQQEVRENGAGAGKPVAGPALLSGSSPGQQDRQTRPGVPAHTRSPVMENRMAFSRWKVNECRESPFEKCGRVFIRGDMLVIHTDRDARGFCIPLADGNRVLEDGTAPILLLATGEPVGVAMRSASGRAVNFRAGQFLYTVPVANLRDVLEGRARKAAVFVGRG